MATVSLTQFQPNSSAEVANQAMKLTINTMAKARHCAVVWFAEIVTRKLFKELGYSSIYQYAEMELGFSNTKTGDFLRLAKKLDELPQLKQDLEQGKVGYTQAREIIKVAKADNEKQWLDEARNSTRNDLAKKVKQAKDRAKVQTRENPRQGSLLEPQKAKTPVAAVKHHLNLEMSTEQFARYEALWEKLHKLGGVPVGMEKIELILAGLAGLVDAAGQNTGVSKTSPVQIHVHKCPDCEKASIVTNRGEIPLAKTERERMECDAQIAVPGQPNKATIPPSVRQKILSRDRHSCQAQGCRNTRFLEVHHKVPRNQGGSNDPDNLITLCGGCHQLLHERGLNHAPFCNTIGIQGVKIRGGNASRE